MATSTRTVYTGTSANDRIIWDNNAAEVHGGLYDDFIWAAFGNYSDFIEGGWHRDFIRAEGGNDVVFGDFISEGTEGTSFPSDADVIFGGGGSDSLFGQTGDDFINGEADSDSIFGGFGNDWLFGGTQSDRIDGGDGNDTLYGNAVASSNVPAAYMFTLTYTWDAVADAAINGSAITSTGSTAGDDNAADILDGGAGNDTLNGQGGADQMFGGSGDDTIYFDNLDTIDGGSGTDFATAGFSAAAITIYTAFVGIEGVYGSLYNDTINAGSQTVRGDFYGYDGNDTISGTIYADYIHGGNGNDTLYVDGTDTIIGADGIDFANAYYSGTAVYFNTGALTIEGVYGSAFNDIINAGGQGMSGSFYGYEGNDIITSSNYADYIHGGNGFDYAAYNGNSSDYLTMFQDGIWYVGQISTGVVDQLVSIESLRFLNGDIALS